VSRTGRRPGDSGTRAAILEAARASFAERGYDASTIRGIAGEAGVDPALVHHYFGTKEGLFAASMALPMTPGDVLPGVLAGPLDDLGERLVRLFLAVWDEPAARRPLIAAPSMVAGRLVSIQSPARNSRAMFVRVRGRAGWPGARENVARRSRTTDARCTFAARASGSASRSSCRASAISSSF